MRALFSESHQSRAGLDRGCVEEASTGGTIGRGVHFCDQLIELCGESLKRCVAALLEFLIMLSGEDDKLTAFVAGNSERFAGGAPRNLAEFVFEHASGDLG